MPKFTKENTHINAFEEILTANDHWGDKIATIPEDIRKDAGLKDPRMLSDNCVFDLFCMGKHGVAFADIPALEEGKLQGHDRDAYFREFVDFLKEHPISHTGDDGKTVFYPENAKAWGELYKAANQKLKEYRLPDINLADPNQLWQYEGQIAMLKTIGTDFVQVINGQMEKYQQPELQSAFLEGFGTQEERMNFHANIVTTQNLKAMLEEMYVPLSNNEVADSIGQLTMTRNYFTQNQDLYRDKTLSEFRENFPHNIVFNTFHLTSTGGKQVLKKFSEKDLNAMEAFLDHGEPLPENVTKILDTGIQEMKEVYYPSSQEHEIAGNLSTALTRNPIKPFADTLENGEVSTFEMSPEQKEKALQGYAVYYDSSIANYQTPAMMEFTGLDAYDLIMVNGAPLKTHTQLLYKDYEFDHDVPEWDELSEAQKEEFYRIEAMRATVDPGYTVGVQELKSTAQAEVSYVDVSYLIKPQKKEVVQEKVREHRELPEPETFSEEQLKQSYSGLDKHLNSFISSLPNKEGNEFMETELYLDVVNHEENSSYSKAYDIESPPIGNINMNGNAAKIYTVRNRKAFTHLQASTTEIADEMDRYREAQLTGNQGRIDYGNALVQELSDENAMLNQVKQDQKEFLEWREREAETVLNQEHVRVTEALEAAQKKYDEAQKKLEETKKRLAENEAAPDNDSMDSFTYNPFSKPVAKKLDTNALKLDEESLSEAEKNLEQAKEQVRIAQEKAAQKRAELDEKQKSHEERVARYQNRFNTMEKAIIRDTRADMYDLNKEKARAFTSAMGPNRLRRWGQGFTDAYMMTQTPLLAANMAYAPVIDVFGSLPAKIAAANRMGFPVYDMVIQTDAAEQTIADYLADKAKNKGTLSPEREDNYRRRLYDQMSRVDVYLDKIYEKGMDKEANARLKELGITDQGNDAFHLHEKAARGTGLLKSTAQATKMGLENGWGMDDIHALAYFNSIRKQSRNMTIAPLVTTFAGYKPYEKPQYKDAQHKDWLDRMDALWIEMEKNPLQGGQHRQNCLANMKELVREGYERDYVNESFAASFNSMLSLADKRTLRIEQGLEPAVYHTENLSMSSDVTRELEDMEKFENLDLAKQEREQAEKEAEKKKKEEKAAQETGQETEPETLDEFEGKMDESIDMNDSIYSDGSSVSFESVSQETARQQEDDFINDTLFGGKKQSGRNPSLDESFSSSSSETMESTGASYGETGASKGESMGESMGETVGETGKDLQYDNHLTDMMYRFSTERSSIFMGWESDEHKNLREALAKMQDARIKAGWPMKADQIGDYLASLDEVVCRGRQYVNEKENAHTPAGQARLKAANELKEYAKAERKRVLAVYNDEKGTELNLKQLRKEVTDQKAFEAEAKIVNLCESGMPATKEEQKQIKELAADIMANNFANSKLEAMNKGFHNMGANVIKEDIMKSKEFGVLMKSYFNNPNMNAENMVYELKSGKAAKKMTKVHKKLQERDKVIQAEEKKEIKKTQGKSKAM